MLFQEAKNFIMPYGKYKNKTLDSIAEEDSGLQYLDWLFGERYGNKTKLDDALAAYLGDESIKKELENL